MDRVEVRVGGWLADGTFTGTLVRFIGEDLGCYTDHDRGATRTLYRTLGEPHRYRVHIERWVSEGGECWLWPQDARGPFYTATEKDARECHARLFAAVGMPNG